jgi:uncharacterized protein YecE (DUF72 family)
MRVAGSKSKQRADVHACIHAGEHRQPEYRLGGSGRHPEVMQPRLHHNMVDRVHAQRFDTNQPAAATFSPVDKAHDPGVDTARSRAEAADEAGQHPIRVGKGVARFGTASWTDPTMTKPGVFYPRGASSAEDRLRYYASQFPLVEVDATYYAMPSKKTSEAWVERTPKDFVFDIKAHALMTGQPTEVSRLPKAIKEELPSAEQEKKRIYRKDVPEPLMDVIYQQFREALEPLVAAGKLGAVFLQFPSWVFPSNEARELILANRRRLELPIAVEFRHGSWFNEKNAERTVKFLQEHKIPYVAVDEPQGFKSSVPPVVIPTSDELAVFRFHGRNKETWEKKNITPAERFRYLYDEDELADWTPKIAAVARETKETHVIYNNCFSNYGTTNAREAALLLEQMQR